MLSLHYIRKIENPKLLLHTKPSFSYLQGHLYLYTVHKKKWKDITGFLNWEANHKFIMGIYNESECWAIVNRHSSLLIYLLFWYKKTNEDTAKFFFIVIHDVLYFFYCILVFFFFGYWFFFLSNLVLTLCVYWYLKLIVNFNFQFIWLSLYYKNISTSNWYSLCELIFGFFIFLKI